jgi:hypothetical protein
MQIRSTSFKYSDRECRKHTLEANPRKLFRRTVFGEGENFKPSRNNIFRGNTGTDAVNDVLCFLSVIINQFFLHGSERLAKLPTRFFLYGKGLKHMRQNSLSNLLEVKYCTVWRSAGWALGFLYIYTGLDICNQLLQTILHG